MFKKNNKEGPKLSKEQIEQNLQGLFDNDCPIVNSGQKIQIPKDSKCPSCGANMTLKGRVLECEFCGTKRE